MYIKKCFGEIPEQPGGEFKNSKEKDNKNTVLFFVSDGEITIDGENLKSFANINIQAFAIGALTLAIVFLFPKKWNK